MIDAAGRVVGQVTSSRRSPKLERSIGLAMVEPEFAANGAQLTISDAERRIVASVQSEPFYDPAGELLRS